MSKKRMEEKACSFCGKPAEGHYAIHRDGFGVGPEVALCDACGGHPTPTEADIWELIAQPSTSAFAYKKQTVHTEGCSDALCAEQYGQENSRFQCSKCLRLVGYCMGAADATPSLCDDCSNSYEGRAWEKPYPGATGTYTDEEGHKWQVIRVIKANMTFYLRWNIDGEDAGATFIEGEDRGKYEHGVFYGPRYVPGGKA